MLGKNNACSKIGSPCSNEVDNKLQVYYWKKIYSVNYVYTCRKQFHTKENKIFVK